MSHAGGCLLRGSAPLRESAFLKLGTLDFEDAARRRKVSLAGGRLLRDSAPLRESAFRKLGTLDLEGVTQRR